MHSALLDQERTVMVIGQPQPQRGAPYICPVRPQSSQLSDIPRLLVYSLSSERLTKIFEFEFKLITLLCYSPQMA